ncbi:MAG: alpha/beta fold hydrolase [Verrucomicrobia bacterium]|nr:alpha/beta fold hydrolase [Verrucomicrobiota bacterium]
MVNLFHRDLGGTGQPPLVILHGLLGSSRNWQTTGRDLAGHFHVSALDLRNHGQSPHAPEMSYGAMVADVLGWLDAHGLGRVTLLGHSLGGKAAMTLACRHPDRVERLVVVDIAPRGYHAASHRVELAAMAAIDLAGLKSRAAAEHALEGAVPDWAMRKFLVTNLEVGGAGGWRWMVNLPVLSAALGELEANPLRAGERFNGPTTFIVGGKSRYVRPEDLPVIHEYFPASRRETIAGAGHNPHIETREAFVALVAAART